MKKSVYRYPKLAWVYAMIYGLTLQEAHDRIEEYKAGHSYLEIFIERAIKERKNYQFS